MESARTMGMAHSQRSRAGGPSSISKLGVGTTLGVGAAVEVGTVPGVETVGPGTSAAGGAGFTGSFRAAAPSFGACCGLGSGAVSILAAAFASGGGAVTGGTGSGGISTFALTAGCPTGGSGGEGEGNSGAGGVAITCGGAVSILTVGCAITGGAVMGAEITGGTLIGEAVIGGVVGIAGAGSGGAGSVRTFTFTAGAPNSKHSCASCEVFPEASRTKKAAWARPAPCGCNTSVPCQDSGKKPLYSSRSASDNATP